MLRRGMWHLVTWGYTASQKMHAEILTILVAHARALAPRGTEDGALALRLNRDHLSAIHVRLLPQSADTGKQSITPVSAATCSTYGSGGDRNDPSRRYGDSHQRRSMPCCWQSLKRICRMDTRQCSYFGRTSTVQVPLLRQYHCWRRFRVITSTLTSAVVMGTSPIQYESLPSAQSRPINLK